jgi:hypothetical protein
LCAENNDQLLTTSQRALIEAQLKKYDIPLHILQKVAQENNCPVEIQDNNGKSTKRPNLDRILPMMDSKSLLVLQQIFLDCQDSYSHFRFAVYLSSMYNAIRYKYVFNDKSRRQADGESSFDLSIYNRETGLLVAVAAQNNDPKFSTANNDSIQQFLGAVAKLSVDVPSLRTAYYSSSYGYTGDPHSLHEIWEEIRKQQVGEASDRPIEIKFFEYKDKVYFEIKSPAKKNRASVKTDQKTI